MKLVKTINGYKTEDGRYSVSITNGRIKGLHSKYHVSRGISHRAYASTLKEVKEIIEKWENEA